MVLVLSTWADNALFCTKFCEITSEGLGVIVRVWEVLCGHYFHCEIFKGA